MVNALCSYFDPRLILMLIPITVLQARFQQSINDSKLRSQKEAFQETLKRFGITSVLLFLIHVCTFSKTQRMNTINLLFANDPGENIGLYWYLFETMF